MVTPALFKLENVSARVNVGLSDALFTLEVGGARIESAGSPVEVRILALTQRGIELTPAATIAEVLIHAHIDSSAPEVSGPLDLCPGATMTVSVGNRPPQVYTSADHQWRA